MKCPSCGAETQGKFCEYCGSEMPKENSTVNITNNYYGGAAPQEQTEVDNNVGKCPKCGNSKITFKRERVGTATQSRSRKNYIGTGRQGQSVSQSAYRTVGVCQNCGYTWNPNATNKGSGKKTWLWVLGWICIFPLPLTILLLRKKDMKPAVKYGVIAIAWVMFFAIGMFGNSETDTPQTDVPDTTIQTEQSTNIGTEDTSQDTTENNSPWAQQEKTIRRFVDEFNAISATPITDIEFRKNHTIAYFVVDDFSGLSIKVNDHDETGFMFTFEFKDGKASLEKYENFMRDAIKVFDANLDVGDKFQEATANYDTTINLSDSISVKYHYIKDAVGYQSADTYIITLISADYNK